MPLINIESIQVMSVRGSKRDEQFAAMIKTAIHFDKPDSNWC